MSKNIVVIVTLLSLTACSQNKNRLVSENNIQSNKSFNFFGYYNLTSEVYVKTLVLKSIEINTHDSLGRSHISIVRLRFQNPKESDYYFVNTSFGGVKDNFSIIAYDSLLGNLKIKGKFFGEKGPSKDDIKDPNTIVFEGTLSVDEKSNTYFKCTYFGGD
jgi:hypothetical protein